MTGIINTLIKIIPEATFLNSKQAGSTWHTDYGNPQFMQIGNIILFSASWQPKDKNLSTYSTTAFTIAEAYRPKESVAFPIQIFQSGMASFRAAYSYILSNGNVNVFTTPLITDGKAVRIPFFGFYYI